jgi:hypothetical protein
LTRFWDRGCQKSLRMICNPGGASASVLPSLLAGQQWD